MSKDVPSLSRQTARNVAWLGVGQAIRQGVSLLTMVALARFLEPSDFGVFTMTLFVNELAQLVVQFGIGAAIIQRKEVSQDLLSTCLWANVMIAAVAGVALIAAGPWAADYFGHPVIRWLMVPAALSLAVSALAVLPQALLSRQLSFQDITVGTLVGSICGALLALALAIAGFGVWALALQPVTGSAITTLYYFIKARWLPSLIFRYHVLRGIIQFSAQLFLSNMVSHFTRNLTNLIIGPSLGAAAMGLINMAQTIAWLPGAQFTQVVVRATFPVFAQIQSDLQRFRDGFFKATGLLALITFPVMFGIALMAPDLVPVVFGPKWVPAITLVMIACIPATVQSVTMLSGTVLLAAGKGAQLLGLSVATLVFTLIPLWLVKDTSPEVALGVIAASTLVGSAISLSLALRFMEVSWLQYLATIRVPFLAAGLTALVLYFTTEWMRGLAPIARMVIQSLVGGAAYLLVIKSFQPELMRQALALVRRQPAS